MSKRIQKKTQKPTQKQKELQNKLKQPNHIAKQAKKVQKPAIAPNNGNLKEKAQKKPPKTEKMKKQAKSKSRSQREEEKKDVDEAGGLAKSSSEENQVEKLQAELEMHQKLAERHNQETVDHLRKINAIEEETADLIARNESLTAALDREKKQHDKQKKVTDVFARKFDAKMQEKLEEESALKTKHEADKKGLNQMLDKKDAEKDTLKRNLDGMTTQKNVLKMQLDVADQTMKQNAILQTNRENQIAELKTQKSDLTKQNADLTRQLAITNRALDSAIQLSQRLDTIRKEI